MDTKVIDQTLHCNTYFKRPVRDAMGLVEQAMKLHETTNFGEVDTLVATGLSGGIVAPMVATMIGINFFIIRKDTEDCHDTKGGAVGILGKKWAFFDDFISLGITRKHITAKVKTFAEKAEISTTFMGSYLYENEESPWEYSPERTNYSARKKEVPTAMYASYKNTTTDRYAVPFREVISFLPSPGLPKYTFSGSSIY